MNTQIDFTKTFYNGEMLPFERYKLYNWIIDIKPETVFEVGTGNGGGSTYYISKAIKDREFNSSVYTCDPMRNPDENFFKEFNFVKYYKQNSDIMIKNLINENILPNFIMFDGPENPEVAFNDIIYLENFIEEGTFFCMHDWDYYRPYDKNHSTKSIKIKKHIENSKNWILIEQLFADKKNSNFDNSDYDSVGLCLYKFKK